MCRHRSTWQHQLFNAMKLFALLACLALEYSGAVHAQAGQPASPLPAQAVAGYWATDAKFASQLALKSQREYWWIGKMWGRIDATGKFEFDADNGCVVSGLLIPYIGNNFQGSAQITNCQQGDMNRRYRVTVSGGQPNLTLTLTASDVSTGRIDQYEVSGIFSHYRP